MANDSFRSGKYAEAATRLERLLPQAPKSFELHELLGLTYASESLGEKAVEQLQVAAGLQPNSAAARTNLATALLQMQRPAEAEVQFHKALDLQPLDYSANHDLAAFYAQSDRLTLALPLFEAAQRIRPGAYDNGYDLALAYFLSGKLTQSEQMLITLSSLRDSGELHNLRGRVDEQQGKFLEAANELATAAHMDPSEDNLFAWASELLLHRTYVPAIEVFRQASQRYPKSPRLWIGLGMSLYSRGEYEESIHALLTATDLDPQDPRSYLFLSKAYLSSPSQAKSVIERLRRYAELQPRNALAQYYLAIGLWKGERTDNPEIDYHAVETLLLKSIALDPKLVDVHLQLGILYTDEREYAKSLPEYQRAAELDPQLPDVHFRLGRYYLRAGEKDKGQSELTLFQKLQAQHQAEVDRERAEVQQFVVSAKSASAAQP